MTAPEIYDACTTAKIGCVECKQRVGQAIAEYLAPLREKRKALEGKQGAVEEVIRAGDTKARAAAVETMTEVREKMHVG